MSATEPLRPMRAPFVVRIGDRVAIDLMRFEARFDGRSLRIGVPSLRLLLAFHAEQPGRYLHVDRLAQATGMSSINTAVYVCELARWLKFHEMPLHIHNRPLSGYRLVVGKTPEA